MTAVTKTTLFALAAAMALALLATITEAHSWADCVDWRFNNPKKPGWTDKHGKCHGWARRYPVKTKYRFGDLDSASPNRHYEQDSKLYACSAPGRGREDGADERRANPVSKAYGGGFRPMASVKAGDTMCVRWPSKNHASEYKVPPVFIYGPPSVTKEDPSQKQLLKMPIAKLNYNNCNRIRGDEDHTPCGGCFKIPSNRKTGTYMIQWRWELNKGEFYTSCWDVQVKGRTVKPNVQSLPSNGTETTNDNESSADEDHPLGDNSNAFSDLARE
ncbi:hypothetical protein BGX27_007141 [Mortierella sp. AM989]|nr:hypothetical protein BGX27_007141 [Mortierella sp. AM989]